MIYKRIYKTPAAFDDLIMLSDGMSLTGLLFQHDNDLSAFDEFPEKDLPVFDETKRWLDEYFEGRVPDFIPNPNVPNLSPFQKRVSEIMRNIPYGKTITYGEIAKQIASENKIPKMSARAVGGAVGKNPICIIIPCHRVLGKDRAITGFSGGIKNKIALLNLEKIPFKL